MKLCLVATMLSTHYGTGKGHLVSSYYRKQYVLCTVCTERGGYLAPIILALLIPTSAVTISSGGVKALGVVNFVSKCLLIFFVWF